MSALVSRGASWSPVQQDVRRLREENELLRERIAQLEGMLMPELEIPPSLGLSPYQTRLMRIFLGATARILSTDKLIQILYPDPDGEPGGPENLVRQVIHNIRKKFRARFGVPGIQTAHGQGWFVSDATAKLIEVQAQLELEGARGD